MTQYAMGAWARVGERLPEYGEQVLAWTGDGGYPVIAYLRRDEHGDFWEGFHNGEEIDPACVTLWTPMPSPPPFEQNTLDQQPRTKEAATMSYENERSVASDGSVADEPVAWAVVTAKGLTNVCILQAVANDWASHHGGEVIPLFAKDKNFSPQAASNAQLLDAIQSLVDQTDPWLSQAIDREYKIHTPEHRNARRAVKELRRRLK